VPAQNHTTSSIAAAGLFEGIFREDMFDEAENLDDPYFPHQARIRGHRAQGMQGALAHLPAGSVVGDSRTGEMDKIDGPYYFFKLIQKLRKLLPPWMPTIGIEGGRINMVPVDFVVDAMDHIAHLEGWTASASTWSTRTRTASATCCNIFARAAHAPEMTMRINAALLGFIPRGVKKA
jgi:thioester reductase-like protein